MKKRTLLALLLCLAMLASLLAGCGGEKKETAEDGRGDVIKEEPAPTSEETLPSEPEVNFQDFYGCWEYWDYDIWLYVYGDGTYEMYNENGDCTAGSYTPEGTEIVLDSGERFALDGEGGLIDEDGDTLFPTELPDFTPVEYFEEGGYSFDLEMDEGMLFPSDAQVSRMRSWRLRPIICKSCWNCPQREANGLPSAFFRTVRCCL